MAITTDTTTVKLSGSPKGHSSHSYSDYSKSQNYVFRNFCESHFLQALDYVTSAFVRRDDAASSSCTDLGFDARKSATHIRVADFGCSYGFNTLEHASLTFSSILQAAISRDIQRRIELQYIFSDLPQNDFNALFRSLNPLGPPLKNFRRNENCCEESMEHVKFFAAGVPGSFYTRLLPEQSVHFSICVFAMHWLSQVPAKVMQRGSKSWNGGHAWIDGPNKAHVFEAYSQQFHEDAKTFLRCRLEELVKGGVMFLVAVSRKNIELGEQSNLFGVDDWTEDFDSCWQDMADEGLVSEEERDMFNVPLFTFHPSELQSAVESFKGTLEVLKIELMEDCEKMHSDECKQLISDQEAFSRRQVGKIASLLMPLVVSHIGEARAQVLFRKFQVKASDRAKTLQHEKIKGLYMNVVVAILRKI
ncbi:hypothetical protein KP509_1Z027700 [Ceratopteris richardii]|nr:hypothetical protein KP509_1Z027700 [Ceratopteris richardii]